VKLYTGNVGAGAGAGALLLQPERKIGNATTPTTATDCIVKGG